MQQFIMKEGYNPELKAFTHFNPCQNNRERIKTFDNLLFSIRSFKSLKNHHLDLKSLSLTSAADSAKCFMNFCVLEQFSIEC